jgi:hypothetical protein
MSTTDRVLMAAGVAWTLAVIAGCRRDAPVASIGNACDRKLLTTADVAPLLSKPVTGAEPIPGDLQSCRFKTAGFPSVTIALRPGLGRATLASWTEGRMPLSASPMAGVGDEAVWVNDLTEVVAEKNDLLCDVQVTGLAAVLSDQPPAARQKAIGTLCDRIFEADR